MQSLKRWVGVVCGLFLFACLGCSSDKKVGDVCKRDAQCEGLLVCFKDPADNPEGKCMKAKHARVLYNKRKKEMGK